MTFKRYQLLLPMALPHVAPPTGDQRCPARGDHALDLTICAARGRGGPLPREQARGVESDHPIDEVDLVLDLSRGDRRVASVANPRGPVPAPDLAGH